MHWAKRREKCRDILSGSRCIYPGSVFDPLSARIAEELGYEICAVAGSTTSLAMLGAPDLAVLTLSEFAAQVYRVNRACTLPAFADADHGYGNALNVMRTIEELETAGVAALTIEDTLLPSGYGSDKVELISLEEGVGKMRAALSARQDPTLAIFARTSAIPITGITDALKRIKAYAELGVDGVFVLGVKTREQLDAIAETAKLPIILGNAAPELRDLDYLSSKGVRICMQGHATLRAAVRAVYDTMKAMRDGTPVQALPGLASAEMMKRFSRDADYRRCSQEFLGGASADRE